MWEDDILKVQEQNLPPGVDYELTYNLAFKAHERLFKCLRSFPKPPAKPTRPAMDELKSQLKAAQQEAQMRYAELQRILPHLRKAASQCKEQLDKMAYHKDSLKVPGTITLYSEAFIKQQRIYESAQYSVERCEEMVKMLDTLLQQSRSSDYGR